MQPGRLPVARTVSIAGTASVARIPDVSDLGPRPIAQARAPRTVDQTGQILADTPNIARLADSISTNEWQQESQLAQAQARSGLLQADIAARQSLENDPDYTTYESRYREKMAAASERASASIVGRSERALFEENTKLDIERGAMAIREQARAKEGDVGRASLDELLSSNRSAALSAKDEATRAALITNTQQALQGAQAKGYISAEAATNLRQKWTQDYAVGYLEIQDPAKRIAILRKPQGSPAEMLAPDTRAQLLERAQQDLHRQQLQAQALAVTSRANGIVSVFQSQGPEAGSQALAKLSQSNLPLDLQADVYSKVQSTMNLLRNQKQEQYADDLASLNVALGNGSAGPEQLIQIDRLWRDNAFSPTERASLIGRVESTYLQHAGDLASAQAIREAMASGTPLDPSNTDQRKALSAAFGEDARETPVGSEPWQGLALAYATRTRMLPNQAVSWVRSAVRSPDPKVAGPAAEFLGSVSATAPDAVSGFDTETRSFAGMVSDMISAGTTPEKAIETARQNVFETNAAILKQRKELYSSGKNALALQSNSALDGYIDRDFDTSWFSSQPAAPEAMRADFNAQALRYYEKTGDIQIARDLAWGDLKRVYGVTEVNGVKQMIALPPERFGVTSDEVRKDVADFITANPQGETAAEDIAVVPDALTLRSVASIFDGQPQMPSYKLVNTKTGDLVVDNKGIPVRYTLPNQEQLTQRIREKQAEAQTIARGQIDQARFDRRDRRERQQMLEQGELR